MNKKKSKAKFYWKLFWGGVAIILFVLFLIGGCGVDFPDLGWSFHFNVGLF